MKTKLEMAHEYAMLHMMNTQYKDVDDLEMVQWAFDYADAMQAEAEKRKNKPYDFVPAIMEGIRNAELEEWQPDWSQAPDWANWWVIGSLTKQGVWSESKPNSVKINGADYWEVTSPIGDEHLSVAPNFNYTGDWRDSLRKRPN